MPEPRQYELVYVIAPTVGEDGLLAARDGGRRVAELHTQIDGIVKDGMAAAKLTRQTTGAGGGWPMRSGATRKGRTSWNCSLVPRRSFGSWTGV